jgi:hypothetical protein
MQSQDICQMEEGGGECVSSVRGRGSRQSQNRCQIEGKETRQSKKNIRWKEGEIDKIRLGVDWRRGRQAK